jgi:hypothetical protein
MGEKLDLSHYGKSMAFQNSVLRGSIGLVRDKVTGAAETASCTAS